MGKVISVCEQVLVRRPVESETYKYCIDVTTQVPYKDLMAPLV